MRRDVIRLALCAMLIALSISAEAQQPQRIPRIGVLSVTSPATIAARLDAFRQALRELGYVEGKNIVIEYRYADGNLDRVPALAAEMVRLNVGYPHRRFSGHPPR